jgi:hypothetical protein
VVSKYVEARVLRLQLIAAIEHVLMQILFRIPLLPENIAMKFQFNSGQATTLQHIPGGHEHVIFRALDIYLDEAEFLDAESIR